MGKRIAKTRRDNGLTQEDFARMIGVSSQAVSKWETGTGFPDITTIPLIADTLNITIDEIFGRAPAETEKNASSFPNTLDELPLIGTFRDAACYSEVEKISQKGPVIELKDGSNVNLLTGEINNTGGTHIRIHYLDDVLPSLKNDEENDDQSKSGCEAADAINSFSIDIKSPGDASILFDEHADRIRWEAHGSGVFMKTLSIDRKGDTLQVTSAAPGRTFRGFTVFNSYSDRNAGEIKITTPYKKGKNLKLKTCASGDFITDIDFETSEISITGSGDVETCGLGEAKLSVTGSGDIEAKSALNPEIKVAGSGDISLETVSGDLSASITGSGDIELKSGSLSLLELFVMGSGDFDAKHVEAEKASIRMFGAGDAVIGKIKGESKERIARGSSLTVLKRG